jgi:hypothetical protein
MIDIKNNIATSTSTDLYLENLADPTKCLPLKQTAKIVTDINASDNEDSFCADLNNNTKKTSIKIDFNSDKKSSNKKTSNKKSSDKKNHSISSDDIKSSQYGKYTSRLASRARSKTDSIKVSDLKRAINDNLNVNMGSFPDNKPPIINTINQNMMTSQPSLSGVDHAVAKIISAKELKFKRMECLAKLMNIKRLGIDLTKDYNMNSDLEEMQAELKYQSDIQSKKDGIQLAKSFMCNAITGIEFLNEKYDPFGFKLKGWSDQVKMNKDDFDTVFGELLDKYRGSGTKMEPELKLALMLILSGASFHASQVINTGLPALDDVIKNNPQLLSNIQSGLNKTISGPSEFEKKKELYDNVKKIHDDKVKTVKPIINQQSKPIETTIKIPSINKNGAPTSVKNLLQNIKKSIHPKSTENYSITIGDTYDTENNTDTIPSVSKNIKTKNRLMNKSKIQLEST